MMDRDDSGNKPNLVFEDVWAAVSKQPHYGHKFLSWMDWMEHAKFQKFEWLRPRAFQNGSEYYCYTHCTWRGAGCTEKLSTQQHTYAVAAQPVQRVRQGSFPNSQIWRSDLKWPDFQCQLQNLPNGCWEPSTQSASVLKLSYLLLL